MGQQKVDTHRRESSSHQIAHFLDTPLRPIKKVVDIRSCLRHFLMEEALRRQVSSILKEGINEAHPVYGTFLEYWNILAFILKEG